LLKELKNTVLTASMTAHSIST